MSGSRLMSVIVLKYIYDQRVTEELYHNASVKYAIMTKTITALRINVFFKCVFDFVVTEYYII